jgi:hypothetical protein
LATIRRNQFTSGADRSATNHSASADAAYTSPISSTRPNDAVHAGGSFFASSR